jgi:hypothetical protein
MEHVDGLILTRENRSTWRKPCTSATLSTWCRNESSLRVSCRMLSSGLFSGVRSLNANVSKHCVCYNFIPTRLWRWNIHSVPKRWHLNSRRRGITQKKANDNYNIICTKQASTTSFLYLLRPRLPPPEGLRLFFEPNLLTCYTPHSQPQSHFMTTRLWRWNRQSVPKRWHLNYRRRGITQKKAYDIQNTTKVWNQDYHNCCNMFRCARTQPISSLKMMRGHRSILEQL